MRYRFALKTKWLMTALLFVTASPTAAEEITFYFSGEVWFVRDDDGVLGGSVTVGTPFSGSYTFESSTPDALPGDALGDYLDAVTAWSLEIGGHQFAWDPGGAADNRIFVGNDLPYDPPTRDYYTLTVPVQPDFGYTGIQCEICLQDPTLTAITDDSLPLDPFDPDVYDVELRVYGGTPLVVVGTLTTFERAAVPVEPATWGGIKALYGR